MDDNWISLKERIPPDDEYYLVWVITPSGRGKAEIYSLLDSEGEQFWYNGNEDESLCYHEATHWQPLPSPPSIKQD